MDRRPVMLASLVTVVMLAFAPAHAADVSMSLELSFAEPFTEAAVWTSCDLSVPGGADGLAVLDAAEATGCIDSYETESFEFGSFVSCINGVCGTDATYWRMSENGDATPFGVDGFEANAGDVLGFSYTTWVGCLADPGLC